MNFIGFPCGTVSKLQLFCTILCISSYRSVSTDDPADIKSTASVKKAKSSKMHDELSVPSGDEDPSTSGLF